jgi:hypothetical protein
MMPVRLLLRNGKADGGREDKSLLGGKGANLAEMTRIGIPVPPGFTITTEVCRLYLQGPALPGGITDGGRGGDAPLEQDTANSSAARATRCWCRCAAAARCPCRA